MSKNPKILKTKPNDVLRSIGNNLSLYVGVDGELYMLDQLGNLDLVKNYVEGLGPSSTTGNIKLIDIDGEKFTNEAEAIAYVNTFTDAVLTNTSFDQGVFRFSVPKNTLFNKAEGFLGKITNAENLQFIDSYGFVTSFESFCFDGNTKNNIFGNTSFKENCFRETTGQNIFGGCTFLDGCFGGGASSKNLFIGECNFGEFCFDGTTIDFNAKFFDNNYFGAFAFNAASGTFVFGNNNIISDSSMLSLNDCNFIFGDYNQFGESGMQSVNEINLTLGSNNTFGGFWFFNCGKVSITTKYSNTFGIGCFFGMEESNGNFGVGCTFLEGCFTGLSRDNNLFFDSRTTFGDQCFINNGGLNLYVKIHEGTFGSGCFQNSVGNHTLLGKTIIGDDGFKDSNPQIENNIQWLETCGNNFASNYTGRMNFLSKLGTNSSATLPSDIFTTTNLCSIHYPNALEYNNAGGKDGDLVNILANATNADNKITID